MSFFNWLTSWLKKKPHTNVATRKKPSPPKSACLMLALEPRYLYDAAGLVLGLDVLAAADNPAPDQNDLAYSSPQARNDGDTLPNHAPILDNSGNPELESVSEDASENPGDTVENLIQDIVSDADSDPVGIAITGADNTNGIWQYSTDNASSWNDLGTVSDTSAILLDPAAKIRFVPDANFSGIAEITFRAWDQTVGNSGDAGVDLSAWGVNSVTASDTPDILTGFISTADIDGDGDADMFSASETICTNADGASADGASSVFAADIDGDGDADVLSASAWDNKIAWYENTDGAGTFGPQNIISTDALWALSVFAIDVDGDGDSDVLSASANDNKIAWYENTDGAGTFGPQTIITDNAFGASAVAAADMDGDGDTDVLAGAANENSISWYENDGNEAFALHQTITTKADGVVTLSIADVDGDNDPDLISASMNDGKIAWYENTGAGTFGTQNLISVIDGASFVFFGDVDSDGDIDVLSTSENDDNIPWYENTDGRGTFASPTVINTAAIGGPSVVLGNDLDGDGDTDMLVAFAFDDRIVWYENTDGTGAFTEKQTLSLSADGVESLFVADIDSDGDPDVLSASWNDDQIAWYENTDGAGNFGEKQVITIEADGASSVFAADLDGDGDADVLSASGWDDKIAWYENIDGTGTFGPQNIITTDADWASAVYAADLDRDGDADVLSASENDTTIAWYRNTDGMGTFAPPVIISSDDEGTDSVFVADIDDDGDLDVFSASSWYENDGAGNFGQQNLINDQGGSISVADMDGDSDPDVLFTSPQDSRINWYENINAYSAEAETAIINVTPVNDPPIAADDEVSTSEDAALSISANTLLLNDTDIEGDPLTIAEFSQPTQGTLSDNGSGTLAYMPSSDFNGPDSFTYTVSDGNGGTDTATVAITVSASGDGPVANDDAVSADEDTPLTITIADLLENDTDADGDALVVPSFTQPSHGELIFKGNLFSYIPASDFNGQDSFTYAVSDGSGSTDTASVSILVSAVNDAPIPNDDAVSTDEDMPLIITSSDLIANDTDRDGDELNLTAFTQPTHGDLVENNDGTLTYMSVSNFNGADEFTYTVSDGNGGTESARVGITIISINDMPVAEDDAIATTEDTERIIPANVLLANDTDADGEALFVLDVSDPSHGRIETVADGVFTYIPNTGFSGTDEFTYTLSDASGGTDTASVIITVNATNKTPVAEDDTFSTDENTNMNIQTDELLKNDTDADGDELKITTFTQPSDGSLLEDEKDTFTYVPNASFTGMDDFTYTISDGKGGTDTASVMITINAVVTENRSPVAHDDQVSGIENASMLISSEKLLENDTDADGDLLVISELTPPSHGSLPDNEDGTFTYTPATNFFGTDTFTYTVSDGKDGTDTGIVEIFIAPLSRNTAPIAYDDNIATDENIPITFAVADLLNNDADADGDVLTARSLGHPANGELSIHGDGTITYSPIPGFSGTDTFIYTIADTGGAMASASVYITVNPVDIVENQTPEAHDDAVSLDEDTELIITSETLLVNDADADGDMLVIANIPGQPSYGLLSDNGDGSFLYTPNADFNGTDNFAYQISDGNGGSDIATVSITVNAVNDPPLANNDVTAISEDVPLVVNAEMLLLNDTDIDGDVLTITEFTQPSDGDLVQSETGDLTYTPSPNFNGSDTFFYTISDSSGATSTATVYITIASANDVPVAHDDEIIATEDVEQIITSETMLENDTDADGDFLVVESVSQPSHGSLDDLGDGKFSYTPEPNFNGADVFTYTISDERGGTDTANVRIVVAPVNDAPVANGETFLLNEDEALILTAAELLANDTDADGDALIIAEVTQPSHGQILENGDGTFTYKPDANFNGSDSLIYIVSDGNGLMGTATVELMVTPVNDAPIAGDAIQMSADEDTELTIVAGNLLRHYTDSDGDTLSVKSITQPIHGKLIDNGDGTFAYFPDANYHGPDRFDFTISDGKGSLVTATANISVKSINDIPMVAEDKVVTDQNRPISISVLSNDKDTDGEALSIVSFTQPAHGKMVDNGDGTLTYTPDYSFFGSEDQFVYTVTDGNGGTASGTVSVTVDETFGFQNNTLELYKVKQFEEDVKPDKAESLSEPPSVEIVRSAIDYPDALAEAYGGGDQVEIVRYQAVDVAKEMSEKGIDPMNYGIDDDFLVSPDFSVQIQMEANRFEMERVAFLKKVLSSRYEASAS